MKVTKIIFGSLLVLAIIYAVIYWEVFKFDDCQKVGHSLAYCIGRIFD